MTKKEFEEMVRPRDLPWMTDDQWECYEMLCDLCKGAHHVYGIVRESGYKGIVINITSGFYAATFDFSGLTKAMILAHDRGIRFEIAPSGPGMLKLFLHKRHKRKGDIRRRHPFIEEAIADVRKRFPND